MQFRGDDRAQSVQIGAILLFGILIIVLATFQATVVPDQNAAVEFDHSQTIQSDMQDLRNELLRASSGPASPVQMALGTSYPNRFVLINPPPPSGQIRTVGGDDPGVNVTLENSSGAVTVGNDYRNAELYWETANQAGLFNTSQIVYTPNYAEYSNPPTTVYENSLLYNRFANGQNRTTSGQQLVQGTTVNLLALQGDLQASRSSAYTVDVTPISQTARTVTVKSEIGDPLYINITSGLPASRWNKADLLGSQPRASASDAGTVTLNGETYHRVAIKLEAGETYELRTSAVGVGPVRDDEIIPEPAYLVVTEEYQPVANGSTETMTVEVRDRYNNPVTGANVTVNVDGTYLEVRNKTQDWGDSATFETNAEGRAEITYRGNETTGGDSAWLNASMENGSKEYEYRNVTGIEVPESTDSGGGGGGSGLNPVGQLVLESETLSGPNVTLNFNNTLDDDVNVTEARLNFYYYSKKNKRPSEANIFADGTQRATNVVIGGAYKPVSPAIVVSPTATGATLTLEFDEDPSDTGTNRDFFVLTLIYEVNGESVQTTYFIGL